MHVNSPFYTLDVTALVFFWWWPTLAYRAQGHMPLAFQRWYVPYWASSCVQALWAWRLPWRSAAYWCCSSAWRPTWRSTCRPRRARRSSQKVPAATTPCLMRRRRSKEALQTLRCPAVLILVRHCPLCKE